MDPKTPSPASAPDAPAPGHAGAALFAIRSPGAPAERREVPPGGYVVVAVDGRLLSYDRRVFEVWGFSADEVAAIVALGHTAEARTALVEAMARHAADEPAVREALSAPPPEDEAVLEEIPLRDGRVLERYCMPTRDAEGRSSGRLAFFRDITGRRQAEADLRARARQHAALAAIGELAMNAEDVDPLLHAACATARDMLGVDAAALLELAGGALAVRAAAGLPSQATGARVDATPQTPAGLALLSRASVVAGELGSRWSDPFLETNGFASAAVVILPGKDGPSGVLTVCARQRRSFVPDDLRFLETLASVVAAAMARRRAEQEVIERERQIRAVFDNALDAMLILDDDGTVLDANPAACALFAATRPQLVGLPGRELSRICGADGPSARRIWAGLVSDGRATGQLEIEVAGQPVRTGEYTARANILPARHLVVIRDVSERKQLHARLALADRMVSVGTLAAGVAHELNNPLAYVNANLSFLAERLARVEALLADPAAAHAEGADLVPQLREAVSDARDGADRMRIIIRDLKTFSRVDEDRTGPVDVQPVLESCINMAWNEIRHRARLVKDFGVAARVRGNEARLGQVFLNLLVNAAQAIPEGSAGAHEIRVVTRALSSDRVAVEIHDSGTGIRPEHRARIFDPFFTTKPPGVGTGLGLSICHSIVSGLGGEIEVESELGKGSRFRVVLPAAGDAAGPRPPRTAPSSRRRGRILVVDDEPLVGTVIQRSLQHDHDITVVSSARAALEVLDRGERFDLVLSDLLMPEMSGMDLYRALSARDPGLARRMVFLTGGAFTPAARSFLAEEPVVCVEKPFELETIRSVLARRLAEA